MVLVDAQGKPVTAGETSSAKNMDEAIISVIQECGEVVAAYSKAVRYGPVTSHSGGELYGDAMLRHISNLSDALRTLNEFLNA